MIRNSKNFSFPAQLAIILMLLGGGLVIGSLVSSVVWGAMTGRSVATLAKDMQNPAYYYAVIILQVVSTFFIFFLPAMLYAMICYRSPTKFLGLNSSITGKQILWLGLIILLTFFLSGAIADLTYRIPLPKLWKLKFDAMEAARQAQEANLIKIDSLAKYLISMVLIAVLPAIFEEFIFRGAAQNFLTRWFKNPWAAIILTAFIFSAIHMSFYGFFVRFTLGIFLGAIFYYSGNLWLAILFHFVFNGVQVTALYILNFAKKTQIRDIESVYPLWLGFAALILLVYAFSEFKKVSWKNQDQFIYEDPGNDDFNDWIAKNS